MKAKKYGIKDPVKFFTKKLFIDLKHFLIVINNFKFKGYANIIKERKMNEIGFAGSIIPLLYYNEEYDKIEKYIISECKIVLEIIKKLSSFKFFHFF